MGLKNEFETAMVIEPSVFEPLKFYCTLKSSDSHGNRTISVRATEVLLYFKVLCDRQGFV